MAAIVSNLIRSSAGSKILITGRLALDSSYPPPDGPGGPGYPLPSRKLWLSRIETFLITGTEQGFSFEYLYPAEHLVVYQLNPPGAAMDPHFHDVGIAVDINQSPVGNVIVPGPFAVLVQNIFADVGGGGIPNTAMDIIPGNVAPGPGQVSVASNVPSFTFFAGDGITTARFTYVNSPTSSVSAGIPSVIAGPQSQVPGGTDLSSLNSLEFQAIGL